MTTNAKIGVNMQYNEDFLSIVKPGHITDKGYWCGINKENNKVHIRHEDLLEYSIKNNISYYISRTNSCKIQRFLFTKNE